MNLDVSTLTFLIFDTSLGTGLHSFHWKAILPIKNMSQKVYGLCCSSTLNICKNVLKSINLLHKWASDDSQKGNILGSWPKKGDGVYTECKAMSDDGILYNVDCPPPSFAEFQCHLEEAPMQYGCRGTSVHHICRKKK